MIKVTVNKAHANPCSYLPILTAGMAKAETVQFVFSTDWDGINKTAVFTDGTTTVDVLESSWTDNTVEIPAEVLTTAGRTIKVGIYGTTADGMTLPTIWAELGKVRPGADPSGDEATDPTLPVWAQLQALIGDLDNLTTKSKDNLVNAINEAAKTGSGTSGGTVEMRVSDGYIQYGDGTTWNNLIALSELKGDSLSANEKNYLLTILDAVVVEAEKQPKAYAALTALKSLWGTAFGVTQVGAELIITGVADILNVTQSGTMLVLS